MVWSRSIFDKFFILPIALPACILRDAIFNFFRRKLLPTLIKGGMFSPMPSFSSMSFTVKPLSATIEIPGLSSSLLRNLDMQVNSISGETYVIAPLGVQATCVVVLVLVCWCFYEDFTAINNSKCSWELL